MKNGSEGGKSFSRREMFGIGAGALATATGLGPNKVEALGLRFLKPEEREILQSGIRDLLNKTTNYFKNFDNVYKDNHHNHVAHELRKFNNVVAGVALDDSADSYYRIDKQLEDIFSPTRHINHVQDRAQELVEYIEVLMRVIDGTFLTFANESNRQLRKERDELNKTLSEICAKFGLLEKFK